MLRFFMVISPNGSTNIAVPSSSLSPGHHPVCEIWHIVLRPVRRRNGSARPGDNMSSADMYRNDLARLKDKEAALRLELNRHQNDELRALEEVHRQMSSASRASS